MKEAPVLVNFQPWCWGLYPHSSPLVHICRLSWSQLSWCWSTLWPKWCISVQCVSSQKCVFWLQPGSCIVRNVDEKWQAIITCHGCPLLSPSLTTDRGDTLEKCPNPHRKPQLLFEKTKPPLQLPANIMDPFFRIFTQYKPDKNFAPYSCAQLPFLLACLFHSTPLGFYGLEFLCGGHCSANVLQGGEQSAKHVKKPWFLREEIRQLQAGGAKV